MVDADWALCAIGDNGPVLGLFRAEVELELDFGSLAFLHQVSGGGRRAMEEG